VEQTLENNEKFGAKDIITRNPPYEKRLRYWTNEMCAESPHTFDLVVTVWFPALSPLH